MFDGGANTVNASSQLSLLLPLGAGCTVIDRFDYAIGQDFAPLDKGMGDTLV